MDYLRDIMTQIELHSVQGIRDCFENGVSANMMYKGKPLIEELISEYARTDRFKECVKLFVDYGLYFEDKALLAVLLDDSVTLEKLIAGNPGIVTHHYTLQCAYTPLDQVTLLHICAEFNHVACATVLLRHKADINAKAGTDDHGFGGQTPIFHTVNQNNNHSKPMLDLLLLQKADLGITVQGIVWGKGYEWETLIPSVNPISYAMMGLLPQMHRSEKAISETVLRLIQHRYQVAYSLKNVPNKYLSS
ncbi:MAG: ankyrin repeat domain-containing protein [Cyclobacteriaceae bacterium]|nr:ankyrin repeat domain-containing protein [Cyclobacteriaceae bacterium]